MNDNSTPSGQIADELRSGVPFESAEPEKYTAEIVVTTGDIKRRTLIVRDGARRRTEFEYGTPAAVAVIVDGKEFHVSLAARTYAEVTSSGGQLTGSEWSEFLTTEWLNSAPGARFEKIDSAAGLTRYRAVLGSSSEAVITVDDSKKMPVREDFFMLDGEQKTLTMTVEIVSFSTEIDPGMFVIPAGFRKVDRVTPGTNL